MSGGRQQPAPYSGAVQDGNDCVGHVATWSATGVTPQDDARRRLLDRRIVAAFRDGQLAFDRVQSGNLLGEKVDPLQAVVDGGRVPADRWQLARTVGGLFDLGLLTGDERLIAESQEWFRLQRSFELERVAVYIETR